MNNLRKIFVQVTLLTLVAALSSSCSAEAKKNRALRRAEEYFKAGDYDKAKLEYTNVLRADPKDPEPFLKIGTIWLEEGAPLRAGPFLIRGKELAPTRADMHTKLGEIYIAVAGLPEARKEASEALRIDPQNEDALLIIADAARSPEDIA
ncbi:MAG: tetratricopeptide repeat protein, partial [Chthoniobacterales bacterium]